MDIKLNIQNYCSSKSIAGWMFGYTVLSGEKEKTVKTFQRGSELPANTAPITF